MNRHLRHRSWKSCDFLLEQLFKGPLQSLDWENAGIGPQPSGARSPSRSCASAAALTSCGHDYVVFRALCLENYHLFNLMCISISANLCATPPPRLKPTSCCYLRLFKIVVSFFRMVADASGAGSGERAPQQCVCASARASRWLNWPIGRSAESRCKQVM